MTERDSSRFKADRLLVVLLFKPYYSIGYNRLNYLLKACNVALSVLVIPFAREIGLQV